MPTYILIPLLILTGLAPVVGGLASTLLPVTTITRIILRTVSLVVLIPLHVGVAMYSYTEHPEWWRGFMVWVVYFVGLAIAGSFMDTAGSPEKQKG